MTLWGRSSKCDTCNFLYGDLAIFWPVVRDEGGGGAENCGKIT